MRIGIDVTSLLLRSAGVKNYIHYWTASLMAATRRSGDSLLTYPPGVKPTAVVDHESSAGSSWRSRLQLASVGLCNHRLNPALNLWARRLDVFHCSQHILHRPHGTKLTATVYDFSCWTKPETHTPANVTATRHYAETILKHSDGLIAISEHTRREAVEILHIPEERIRVIYPGVADAFFDVRDEDAESIRRGYDLLKPFLLFVGCIEPRKNVPRLVSAYNNLPESLRRDVSLVIAGPFGWESVEMRKILELPSPGIRYLGYVPETKLPGLFRAASAFIYPSLDEGFGLPVAQAMACGVPVITSNCSCLPEVAGNAAILVDPTCVDELTHAMQDTLTSSSMAERLRLSGKNRARAFRWDECADRSLLFFREVVHGS